MEFHVLIDDLRELDVDVTARTVDDAKRVLQEHTITHLWLDNDLGDDQPMEGIDILNWARDNNLVPPNVIIVSGNPVGKRRMEDVLHFDLKYTRDGNWWRKV